METNVIVSAIGEDHPGIVHKISQIVFDRGGNITMQRSVKLGGDFAVILMFAVEVNDSAELDGLLEQIAALEDTGLQISARPATTEAEEIPTTRLEISGADQPGIINTLTQFLVRQNINIHAMDCTVASAAFTATPLFNAVLQISLPPEQNEDRFMNGLRRLETDLNVDIQVTEAVLPATA